MSIHCELVILMLALSLDDQVHTGQIIGGHEAVPHSRPYMVLLVGQMLDAEPKYCGGFLLNKDFVMTAAHCQASHFRSYTVVLGLHNVHNPFEAQSVSVEKAFPHKDYNQTDHKNDIMLLKLSSKAKFSRNVRPIALAGHDYGSLPKSCIVSGWGRADKNTKYMSRVLMEVNVTLIDNKQCPTENTYCSEGETGPAKGDSGGPLVCEDEKAYGVVSSFKTDSNDQQINSYTKIPDYRSWIDSTMVHHGKQSYM